MGKLRIIVFMAVMLLWGCSGSPVAEEKVLPVIEVQCPSTADEESQKRIEAAVNEITKEYGFMVDLNPLSLEQMSTEVNIRVLDGSVPDILFINGNVLMAKQIKNQVLAPVSQLFEPYPELQEYMKGIRLEGMEQEEYYSLRGNNESVFRLGFAMRRDICRELGIEADQVNSMEELYQVLLKVKKAYPDMILVTSHDYKIFTTLGQEALGDDLGVLMTEQQDTQVTDLFSTDYFYDICRRMHQWYQEGLILQDAVYNNQKRTAFISSGRAFGYFLQVNSMTPVDSSLSSGQEMVSAVFTDPILNNVNDQLNWCISASSPHKEEAARFLYLLFTDPEFGSLCQFGQEGIDYIRLDENRIMNITWNKSKRWFNTSWGWPNRKNLPVVVRNKDSYPVYGEDELDHVSISPAYGFCFDPEKVQIQSDLCSAVYQKYYWLLVSGMLDPDQGIPMFLKELNENGYQDILSEKQRQLDIWLEAKNKN